MRRGARTLCRVGTSLREPARQLLVGSSTDLPERLDFLKADIEGTELGLLQGGASALARFGPLLMLEVQRKSTVLLGYEPAEVFRRLARYAYTACYLNSEGALVEAGNCHGELPDYNFVFQR